jgi:hypothetical protein
MSYTARRGFYYTDRLVVIVAVACLLVGMAVAS